MGEEHIVRRSRGQLKLLHQHSKVLWIRNRQGHGTEAVVCTQNHNTE